jgi:hypothetical protein
VSGFNIATYEIDAGGSEAVIGVRSAEGKPQIWLVSLDRRTAPVLIASEGEDAPYFGVKGENIV